MARAPLPPVRDKAFDDEDINPEIIAAIDTIQARDIDGSGGVDPGVAAKAKAVTRLRLVGLIVTIAAIAVWLVY